MCHIAAEELLEPFRADQKSRNLRYIEVIFTGRLTNQLLVFHLQMSLGIFSFRYTHRLFKIVYEPINSLSLVDFRKFLLELCQLGMEALVSQFEGYQQVDIILHFFISFVDEINGQMWSKPKHDVSCKVEGVVMRSDCQTSSVWSLHDGLELTLQPFKIYGLSIHANYYNQPNEKTPFQLSICIDITFSAKFK